MENGDGLHVWDKHNIQYNTIYYRFYEYCLPPSSEFVYKHFTSELQLQFPVMVMITQIKFNFSVGTQFKFKVIKIVSLFTTNNNRVDRLGI